MIKAALRAYFRAVFWFGRLIDKLFGGAKK
jgi:hypothetical protein